RLVDVGHRGVLGVLVEAARDVRLPALAQFLERRNVEVAVVKVVLEPRHVAGEEAAVLADGVAAHRRHPRRHVLAQEVERGRFHVVFRQRRRLHLVDEARLAVRRRVPRVHAREDRVALMDDPRGTFGHGLEVDVGDDHRDLEDAVGIGLEPCHLEVDPDEACGVLGHVGGVESGCSFSHTACTSMTAFAFGVLFVVAIASMVAAQLWLGARQIAFVSRHRDSVPGAFAARISLAAHQKAADYTIARQRFARIEHVYEALVTLLLTLGGGMALGAALTQMWPAPWNDVALVAGLVVVTSLAGLPFAWWRTFVLEARFGFNRTTLATWLADIAKGAVLSAVLGVPL